MVAVKYYCFIFRCVFRQTFLRELCVEFKANSPPNVRDVVSPDIPEIDKSCPKCIELKGSVKVNAFSSFDYKLAGGCFCNQVGAVDVIFVRSTGWRRHMSERLPRRSPIEYSASLISFTEQDNTCVT